MADVLSTGLSSLRSLQRALDTTSHNIANVSTEGYTRQRVEFQARPPEMLGGGWVGTGVQTSTVRRVYDQFLAQQGRSSGTNLARLDAFASQAARIDNLLGDSANGLSNSLQSFTDAINEVSATPSSIPARQALIAEGRALAERLKTYDSRMRDMSAEVNGRLSVEAQEITTLAQGIAKLNGDINVAVQQSGQPPNDLLDKRDALINELSGKVAVSVVAEGDASLNVFIGNGQPLVLGNQASQVTTTVDPLDPERTLLSMRTGAGTVDLSRVISGGTLGGLLDWRSQMLEPARNELGRIGVAIAGQVNAQHRAGMDLTGAMGGNFFNIGAATATPATANAGTAAVTVTRTNLGALTPNDLVLSRTATGYTLRRQDTGAAVAFTGAGTVADPIVADGLSIVVGAGIATGDQHTIRPTRNALALADSLRTPVLNGGTTSAFAAIEKLTTDVAMSTQTAQVNRDAETAIHDADVAAQDAVSGVNLDEEAANLLRYQQAYAAAAQIISVANDMFNTLLNAVRR